MARETSQSAARGAATPGYSFTCKPFCLANDFDGVCVDGCAQNKPVRLKTDSNQPIIASHFIIIMVCAVRGIALPLKYN